MAYLVNSWDAFDMNVSSPYRRCWDVPDFDDPGSHNQRSGLNLVRAGDLCRSPRDCVTTAENYRLLEAKRLYGIDAGGPLRRNPTRANRHYQKNRHDGQHDCRVIWAYSEELARQNPANRQRADDARRDSR